MARRTPLQKAVDLVGGQSALAQRLTDDMGRNVRQSHIWAWLNRYNGRVPAEFAIPIERVVEGQVTRGELRPDIYPDQHVA